MKYLLILALAVLAGCTQIQAKLDTQVSAVTVPDLQAAIADAKAANDADGVDCWTQVLDYVQSLPVSSIGTPEPSIVGVASGIEAARTVAAQPVPTFPPIPASLHKACAVLVVDSQELALKLGISAAALKTGLGVVKLQSEAAALKIRP